MLEIPQRRLPPEDAALVRAERQRLADQAAALLEAAPPRRPDASRPGAAMGNAQYQEAVEAHRRMLDEAQRIAIPLRQRENRETLSAQSPLARSYFAYAQQRGVPQTVLPDSEYTRQNRGGSVGVYKPSQHATYVRASELSDRRDLTPVHEFVHALQHDARIRARPGDPRSREQVIAQATAAYDRHGVDSRYVPLLVDATYHREDFDIAHVETRFVEHRLRRELSGMREPLGEAEARAVIDQVVEMRRLEQLSDEAERFTAAALVVRARELGLPVTPGATHDQVLEDVHARRNHIDDELDRQVKLHAGAASPLAPRPLTTGATQATTGR